MHASSRPDWPAFLDVDSSEWHVALTHEHTPRNPGCQPAVLSRYVDATSEPRLERGITTVTEYAAACHGCAWMEAGIFDENEATEVAHDHAFSGWRDTPVIAALPYEPTQRQTRECLALIERLYPAGWIERCGPVRTLRSAVGTRHVPGRAPTGGYDLCGGVAHAKAPARPTVQGSLF